MADGAAGMVRDDVCKANKFMQPDFHATRVCFSATVFADVPTFYTAVITISSLSPT